MEQFQFLSFGLSIENVLSPLELKIKAYLVLNEFSAESCAFTKELIDQMIANPDLNLDIAASFKSPMNIDRSARDQNTPEGARFNEIYDKLKDVPEFKALFVDLFNLN